MPPGRVLPSVYRRRFRGRRAYEAPGGTYTPRVAFRHDGAPRW
jgi:hypothetical protein